MNNWVVWVKTGGLDVLGYRRLGCEDGAPDVTDVDTNVSGDCVVPEDFNSFSDAAGVPVFNAGDEFGLVQVYLVVLCLGVFDNGDL